VQRDGPTSKNCRNWDLKGKQIKILLSQRQRMEELLTTLVVILLNFMNFSRN
jgi:hypothetical protein